MFSPSYDTNFVMNGVLSRLPIGFRFEPTDEELIVHYLKKKVTSCPFPAYVIPEVEVCKSDPWDLPGDSEKEMYFFSTNEAKYRNGSRPNRATGSGYWKATGIDKQIVDSEGNQLVGMRKTLVFYRGKSPHSSKTDWIMHEYRLADCSTVRPNKKIKLLESSDDVAAAIDNWVLCRIFLKKKCSKKEDEDRTKSMFFYNLNVSPASSNSSGITAELPPTHEPDDHEENSSRKP